MSKKFQFFALFVMLLCSIIVAPFHSMTVHAQTTYPINKDGYEQWLHDNDQAKRNVKCPDDNKKYQDKFTMNYCQCVSWVVFNLSQAGLSDDFINKLTLKSAGTWASNPEVRAKATFIDDATAQKWAPVITKWYEKTEGGVASFKFFSFGPSIPLILEIVYKNGGGHVLIADGVTSGTLNLTEYNGGKTGDFKAFSLVRLAINPPVVNSATGKVAWAGNVSWTGSGGKFFQMCDRNSNFRNCLVNEAVSGNAYQAKSEAWARLQRGEYCARVGESNNGPWSEPVCFSIDNTARIELALFRICIINTNQCLDVKDRVNKDKTIVQIWIFTGSGGTNQKWYMSPTDNGYYTIRPHPSFSSRCLDVSSKEQLQIYNCHYGTNQQFRFVDMGNRQYLIEARHSGKVLDVKGGVNYIKNGTSVQQYDGHGLQNQRWYLTPVTK